MKSLVLAFGWLGRSVYGGLHVRQVEYHGVCVVGNLHGKLSVYLRILCEY